MDAGFGEEIEEEIEDVVLSKEVQNYLISNYVFSSTSA